MRKHLFAVIFASMAVLGGCSSQDNVPSYESSDSIQNAQDTSAQNTPVSSDNSSDDPELSQEYPLFYDGLVAFQSGEHWGYLDKSGSFAISPVYDAAVDFSEGLARVGIRNGETIKYGFIDTQGNYVIDATYDWASDFYDGIAVVDKGGYIGVIDLNGEYLINPQYEPDEIGYAGNGIFLLDSGSGYSNLCDKNGEKISEEKFKAMEGYNTFQYDIKYDQTSLIHTDGLLPVEKANGCYCYINNNGKTIIDTDYCRADEFSEGLAAIGINKGTEEEPNIKYGYINEKGKEIITPQFDFAGAFSEGLASVGMAIKGENYKYNSGFIDKSGKCVINPDYLGLRLFRNGVMAVEDTNEKWGLIDKTGNAFTEMIYDSLGFFYGDMICFEKDGKYGYMDLNGQVVISETYPWASAYFSDGYAIVATEEKKLQLIDKNGKTVCNDTFDHISSYGSFCKREDCFEMISSPDFFDGYCYKHSRELDDTWEKAMKDGTFIKGEWISEDGKVELNCNNLNSIFLKIEGENYNDGYPAYSFVTQDDIDGFGSLESSGADTYIVAGINRDELWIKKSDDTGDEWIVLKKAD